MGDRDKKLLFEEMAFERIRKGEEGRRRRAPNRINYKDLPTPPGGASRKPQLKKIPLGGGHPGPRSSSLQQHRKMIPAPTRVVTGPRRRKLYSSLPYRRPTTM